MKTIIQLRVHEGEVQSDIYNDHIKRFMKEHGEEGRKRLASNLEFIIAQAMHLRSDIENYKEITPVERLNRALFGGEPPYNQISEEKLKNILNDLTERERVILEMRFGFKDGVVHTLEEVGKTFNVTRERIRQMESRALERIKIHD